MGLYDYLVPSEVAIDLALNVRRVRRNTKLDVVPMLVVEGPADEDLWGKLCIHGGHQVFAAGTRDLVEQLLVHLRSNPIEGCECVFLTDCDGKGKEVSLRAEAALVVTNCCDIEADLVEIGVLERVMAAAKPFGMAPDELVDRAIAIALRLSSVRRAAASVSVSMKRGGRRLRLVDLPWDEIRAWDASTPDDSAVLNTVRTRLGWDEESRRLVENALSLVPKAFVETCSGKDVVDAAFQLGAGADVRRFETPDQLHAELSRALSHEDLENWEVGRRIRWWETNREHQLLVAVA